MRVKRGGTRAKAEAVRWDFEVFEVFGAFEMFEMFEVFEMFE